MIDAWCIPQRMKQELTELRVCSVWMLTKTRGAPEDAAAVNQAIHLVVVDSTLFSCGNGMKRMELITVERRSGK